MESAPHTRCDPSEVNGVWRAAHVIDANVNFSDALSHTPTSTLIEENWRIVSVRMVVEGLRRDFAPLHFVVLQIYVHSPLLEAALLSVARQRHLVRKGLLCYILAPAAIYSALLC